MFTLLKIIFFGGSTVLNLQPINLGAEPVEIQLAEPINAITAGASINIKLGDLIVAEDVHTAFDQISRVFPQGCVIGILHSNDGDKVELAQSSGRWSDGGKALNLSAISGISTDLEFTMLEIWSCREIPNTTITWYNYSI